MPEDFKVRFLGDASDLQKASQLGAASITNLGNVAQKVASTDAFGGLATSATKAVNDVRNITSGLKDFKIGYQLPDFAPLKALVADTTKNLERNFVTSLPAPDTRNFSRVITSVIQASLAELDRLKNQQLNLGSVRPPDLTPLKQAIETAKADITKAVIVTYPKIEVPPIPAVKIPPVVQTDFNASVNTLSARVTQANNLLSNLGIQVTIPPVIPPDLSLLRDAVATAKANIQSVGTVKMPTIEVATLPPLDTRNFDKSTLTIADRVKLVNSEFKSISGAPINAPALIPFDVRGIVQAVDITKAKVAEVQNIKVPFLETPAIGVLNLVPFDRSVQTLRTAVETANSLLHSIDTTIPPAVIPPPDMRAYRATIEEAKRNIAAGEQIKLPTIQPPVLSPIDDRAFQSSFVTIRDRLNTLHTLFSSAQGTQINAPFLQPPDFSAIQRAVQVAKQNIDRAFNTPIPVDNFSSASAKIQALVAGLNNEKINVGVLTPDFSGLSRAVEIAKANVKTGLTVILPPVQVPTVTAINTTAFDGSVGSMESRMAFLNNLFKTVSTAPINAPILQPFDTKGLLSAVAVVKNAVASVSDLKLPFLEVPKLGTLDPRPFQASVIGLQNSVQRADTLIDGLRKNIVAVRAIPFVVPTPIPPDMSPVLAFVRDVKAQLATLRSVPNATLEAPLVQPLNLTPFQNSVKEFDGSVLFVHNLIHALSSEKIATPPLAPLDPSRFNTSAVAFVSTLDSVNTAINRLTARSIILPTPVVPPIPPIPPLPLPPLDATKWLDTVKASILDVQRTAGLGFKFELIGNGQKGVIDLLHIVEQIQKENIVIPFSLAPFDARKQVAEIKAAFASAFTNETLPAPKFGAVPLPVPIQPLPTPDFKPLQDGALSTADKLAYLQRVLNGLRDSLSVRIGEGGSPQLIRGLEDSIVRVQTRINTLNGTPIVIPFKAEPFDVSKVTGVISEIKGDFAHASITLPPLAEIRKSIDAVNADPINITAGNSTSILQGLENELASFRKQLQAATSVGEIERLNNSIGDTQRKIKTLESLHAPFDATDRSTSRASYAILNLNRVLQNLPLAAVGGNVAFLGSDIEQMIRSFVRLQAQAKTTGTSLVSNIAGALSGGAGIGLAIAATSAVVQIFGDRFQKLFAGVDKGKQAFQNLQKSIQDAKDQTQVFLSTLDDVSFSHLEGAKQAQTELVSVQALYKASQDQNISLSTRKQAVDELQKQYPSYFSNIKDETILAGGAKEAYDKLTTAILASAKARAIQDKLVELQKEALDVDAQRAGAAQKLFDLAKKSRDAEVQRGKSLDASVQTGGRLSSTLSQVLTNVEQSSAGQFHYNEQLKEALALNGRFYDLQQRMAKLAGQLEFVPDPKRALDKLPKGEFDFFDKFFSFSPDAINLSEKKIAELVDAARAFQKAFGTGPALHIEMPDFETLSGEKGLQAARKYWAEFQKGVVRFVPAKIEADFNFVPKPIENVDLLPRFFQSLKQEAEKLSQAPIQVSANWEFDARKTVLLDEIQKTFKSVHEKMPKTITLESGLKVEIKTDNSLDQIKEALAKKIAEIKQAISDANQAIDSAATSMFEAVGNAFGKGLAAAISSGNPGEIFKGLFASFGSIIEQLGENMLKVAAELLIVKSALKSLNPALVAAAGVGLIAIGALITKSTSNIPGLQEGGLIPDGFSGDSFGPVFLNSREVVVPLDRLESWLALGSNAKVVTPDFGSMRTAPQTVKVVVDGRVRGTDIHLSQARTAKSLYRTT